MDSVYGLYNNHASSEVGIKNYFDEYLKTMKSGGYFLPNKKNDEDITKLMGVDLGSEELSMLQSYCSIDNLTVEGEDTKKINSRRMRRKSMFEPREPEDIDLQTIQNLRTRWKEKSKTSYNKYKSELFINYEEEKNRSNLAVPGQDVLIFVRIYNPFKHDARNAVPTQHGSKLSLNNVTAVLGFQTLAELRDKIPCISDQMISMECSNNINKAVGPMAKDVYKSGFFYIEDTFYNDTRCPENIDYSEVIIKWAQRRSELGPFKTAIMEDCRIDSLCLRFGYPWVYKHQGGCEHLIIFSDARLINCDDELAISAYPRIVRLKPHGAKNCMMCGLFAVEWITMEHEGIPHNPCLFCDSCFKSYNYINKKKVANFRAFTYPRSTKLDEGII